MAFLAICSCHVEEIISDEILHEPILEGKVFKAIIDDSTSAETRSYLDSDGSVLWNQGDQVSVFAATTGNLQYQVSDDSAGKTEATLKQIGGSSTSTTITGNVAFYPYASGASIAESEGTFTISGIELPATQTYIAGSFGNGAFPMAAVSPANDNNFKFKNLLGGLKLQLKGTATIASISITGNNNEILCGAAEVTASNGGTPSIRLTGTDAAAKTVTLNCGAGVTLDPDTATPFVIALPEITMSKGFTVTVKDNAGKRMVISTSKAIDRSQLRKMPAVEFVENEPFTITSTGSTTISISIVRSPDPVSLEYCKTGDSEWSDFTVGTTTVELSDGESVQFRANGTNTTFSSSASKYYKIVVAGTGTIVASGNIMSLLDRELEATTVPAYCFANLFNGCDKLTDASELRLPATTLANSCYYGMFSYCTGLTTAPELPATTLAEECYGFMFSGCTSLTTAPELSATTLAEECYDCMFQGCTGLTKIGRASCRERVFV